MSLSPQLIAQWKQEEACAHIRGWDFSHLDGRLFEDTDFGWDYRQEVLLHLEEGMRVLDLDTGGGEFLRSLNHPFENTAATENYPPNVALCIEILLPLGIDFCPGSAAGDLPFPDDRFDLVINRHGDFHAEEIFRVLKPGGLFITQQVGAENDRELVELLCSKTEIPFPEQYLSITSQKFREAGFQILRGEEVFRPIRFFDVGALVWFARIIQWEFPHFSVDTHLDNLLNAQKILDRTGSIDGSIHRFLLVAQKPR
jgi:SAM-dependent methyltransferase